MMWSNFYKIDRYRKCFKDIDCSTWDIDNDTGSIAYVVISKSTTQRKMNGYIDWLRENAADEWFFDHENEGIVFYFKKYDDALIFKLGCM